MTEPPRPGCDAPPVPDRRRPVWCSPARCRTLPAALADDRPAAMQAALKAVIGDRPLHKGRIKIELPPLVENGNAVPLGSRSRAR